MTTKRLSAAESPMFHEQAKELGRICEQLRPGTGDAIEHFMRMAFDEGVASAQPRWIATFEPKGTTPTKICEPAKRTAEIIFEEMEERLKEAGVTRKTDKTLSAIPAILERLVQYAINEAVHDAADAPEGDQS